MKFSLNQHFIQTFISYYPSLIFSFGICALYIHICVLKFFTFHFWSLSKLAIVCPLLGKKDTIWHWDRVLITDPYSLEKNLWLFNWNLSHGALSIEEITLKYLPVGRIIIHNLGCLSPLLIHTNYFDFSSTPKTLSVFLNISQSHLHVAIKVAV